MVLRDVPQFGLCQIVAFITLILPRIVLEGTTAPEMAVTRHGTTCNFILVIENDSH